MTQQEALQILINSVKVANKRGAYELEESYVIMDAINTFLKNDDELENNKTEKNKFNI